MPVFLGHVGAHGRVTRPCLASFTSPTPIYVAQPWQLIASPVGEKLFPYFTRSCLISWYVHCPWHAHVPGRLDGKTLCFKTQLVVYVSAIHPVPRVVAFILHR
ncbi:hypothetical protein GOBAR_AA31764 [Gossypium barbadense]|uniref:Uncharacterized protein n=1 Tax=Gossypium barbadense TaxID=3634 RepID=A0A2P5WCW3_GOSBA|nr:hypothetical protein GOBAR_AA31764 [Gossypium barbadense]